MEERVLNGDLIYDSSMQRLEPTKSASSCWRCTRRWSSADCACASTPRPARCWSSPATTAASVPELTGHPAVLVSYRFDGFLDEIYATLVVKLHHTQPFNRDQLWRYAADFKTQTGKQLGVKLSRRSEGAGELEVYFDPAIPVEEKIIFSRYVHEHLLQKALEVERLRYYVCPHCGTPVGNREVAMKRLGDWLDQRADDQAVGASGKTGKVKTEEPTILCVCCEKRMPLWDEMEQCFASPEIQQRVRELLKQSEIVLDSESKERILVGEVISTVALADQICREFTVSDHGIDMEIEFKDDRSRSHRTQAVSPAQIGRFVPARAQGGRRRNLHDQGRTPRPLLDGAGVPGVPGDPQLRGRSALDGSARLAEAREQTAQEAGETNRFRGRTIRRDERAPVAGEDACWIA